MTDRDEPGLPAEPSDDELVEALFPSDEPDDSAGRRPITFRGVAIVGARAVTGLVGIGVALVTVGAASFVPLPSIGSEPTGVLITPVPTAQQLVCAGAFLRLADDTGQQATVPSAVGPGPTIDYGASAGNVDATPVKQSDAGTAGTRDAPVIVSAPPTGGGERPLISGAQFERVDTGEFVGLAAGSCAPATGEAWFPAGSTEVGRTALITLANPTEVAATVDIRIYDENGSVSAPGTSGIIVPPNGQRVLSLAGFAPDLTSPVVHITSTGGQVVASLQQAIVRGLDPGGLDLIAPVAATSTKHVIPGVVISNVAGVQQLTSRSVDYADAKPVLRLFVPGQNQVDATLAIIPEDGTATSAALEFEFAAGSAIDVPLDGFEAPLADGQYTLVITTSEPSVAAARVTAAGTAPAPDALAPSDLAWFAAGPVLTNRAQVTIADGPSPVLHLHNPTGVAASVTVGEEVVELLPGSSVARTVTPGVTLGLSGFAELVASVTYLDGGGIAGYPVLPPGAVSSPVIVYP